MPPVWDGKDQYINQDHVLKIINHDSCALYQYFFTHHICDISQLCVEDDKVFLEIMDTIFVKVFCTCWNAKEFLKINGMQQRSENAKNVKYFVLLKIWYLSNIVHFEIIFVKNIWYLLEILK